jgi:serine/threonine-protein kinase
MSHTSGELLKPDLAALQAASDDISYAGGSGGLEPVTGLLGQKVVAGKYEVLSFLAAGGSGTIFVARNLVTGETVALKVLDTDCSGRGRGHIPDGRLIARFLKEGRTLSMLSHPGVVKVLDSGFDLGINKYYLVQRFLPGETVEAYLERNGKSPASFVLEFLWQLGSALSYCHSMGVVHRDIKPANIMMQPHLKGKFVYTLVDFGLARYERGNFSFLTRSREVLGSHYYMSPEQCLSETIDERSDIYSLALVAHELLLGRKAVNTGSPLNVLMSHVNGLNLSEKLEGLDELSAILYKVIYRAASRRPEDRYQSLDELLLELPRPKWTEWK